ncbi:MAG TPA: PQQ-binding-like beta-propeller repeat protein [Gemmatimonadales bacterium]|nr:PQQ-binding-like beta-propeller repeat protein [Gemmatimonadales bacterium]
MRVAGVLLRSAAPVGRGLILATGALARRIERLVFCTVVLAGLSCSGDRSTGPDPVAYVTVSVVGDSVLLPTQRTLLVASPKDALGKTLTDRAIEWSSSNPAVATIVQTGWVTAVGPGDVMLAAVSEGQGGIARLHVNPVPVASVTVAVQGDSVIEDGTTRRLNAAALDSVGDTLAGRPFRWSSSDPTVVTVTNNGLVRGVWVGSARITATTEGRSGSVGLRVVQRPVATVTVTTSGFDALYGPQGSLRLGVTLQAANGDTLNPVHRPVTWSSSNVSVATVDSTGVVTGVSPGPVTISATREAHTGSVNLTVLPAATSNWAAASEWVTYQGNAEHTGHVAASADPRAFRARWTKVVLAGARLSPAVASDGRVFVATETYFATQILAALDAATGQSLWTQNFGPIHGVHQPAAGNGRVYVTTSGQTDSYLYAFDAATGARAFRSPYGNQWERYYAPIVTPDAVYLAGGYYGGMYRFDANSGAQVWFFQTNQYDMWTPALRDTVVYSYTGSYSPKVTANSATSGALLYAIPDSSFNWNGWSMNTAPVLGSTNDLLATQANRLVAFDLGTRTVRWQRIDHFRGTVSVAGGTLYVVNGDGVEARSETDGALLWGWQVPAGAGTFGGTLALTDNLLFASTESHTYALDLQRRAAVWSYPAGGRLSISSQGILYIAQANGTLSAIAMQ